MPFKKMSQKCSKHYYPWPSSSSLNILVFLQQMWISTRFVDFLKEKPLLAAGVLAAAGGLICSRWMAFGGGNSGGGAEYIEVGAEGAQPKVGVKRVLVIGSNGFIGRNVVRQLVEDQVRPPCPSHAFPREIRGLLTMQCMQSNEKRAIVAFDTRIPTESDRIKGVK